MERGGHFRQLHLRDRGELGLPGRRAADADELHLDARPRPGQDVPFTIWAGDAKGRESVKSKVTVTLPVDTTRPAAPVVSVTDRHVVDRQPHVACGHRRRLHLLHLPRSRERLPGAHPVDRGAGRHGRAARRRNDLLVHGHRRRPVAQRVGPQRGRDCDHAAGQRHDRPDRARKPLRVRLRLRDLALLGEVRRRRRPAVLAPLRGAGERRLRRRRSETSTAGSPTARRCSNTFTVQAIDSAGNRSPISSITLDNQAC